MKLDGRFLTVTGDVRVTAVKTAEDGESIVVRLHNNGNASAPFTLTPACQVLSAHLTDLGENAIGDLAVQGNAVSGECAPYAICTVLLRIKL